MEAFGPHDQQEISWRHLDKHRLFAWQFVVFMGIRLVLYPTTLLKTHIQARPSLPSISAVFSSIYAKHGMVGLWSGFPSLAVGLVPSQIVFMSVYESVKERIDAKDPIRSGIAGATASLASQIVMVPVDVVSQSVQLRHSSSVSMAKEIVSKEGFRGLYRGFSASAALYIPFSAIWWATYSGCRRLVYSRMDRAFPSPSSPLSVTDLVLSSCCGVAAATTAVVSTAPLDLIKTLKQTTMPGKSARQIVAEHRSISDLWRGCPARLMGALPFSVFGIAGYEFIKRMATVEQ